MIDELILHIGPVKTATTSIQQALAASAAEQRRWGTFIPLATGTEPAQHLPILREIVGDTEYRNRYGFSQDVLSLDDTLREATAAGCDRILISAEQFGEPSSADDVLALLQAIRPKRVAVLQAARPASDWTLSVYAQHITYGLSEPSTWPIERFAKWFATYLLPGSTTAVDRWRSGPWRLSLRTMFLAPSGAGDVGTMFQSLAKLPAPLAAGTRANERLDPCQLHFLQALNLMTFNSGAPVESLALAREPVVAALRAGGTPEHDCSCPVVLALEVRTFLHEAMAEMLPDWIAESEVIHGDPRSGLAEEPDGLVHCRFPDRSSSAVVATLLARAVDDLLDRITALTEARDFWHAQATNWMDLAKS